MGINKRLSNNCDGLVKVKPIFHKNKCIYLITKKKRKKGDTVIVLITATNYPNSKFRVAGLSNETRMRSQAYNISRNKDMQ